MSDGNSSAQCDKFPTEPVARKRALACRGELCGQSSSPLALGLLGLALMITLWGFGSRLSLYCSPSDPSALHILKARLWSECRSGMDAFTSQVSARKLKARAYVNSGVFAPVAVNPKFLSHETQAMPSITGRPRSIPFFHSAIPLRSPPSVSL